MVHSRFGKVCSCCCLSALPGPAWVLLSYVLRTILCTSVDLSQNVYATSEHLQVTSVKYGRLRVQPFTVYMWDQPIKEGMEGDMRKPMSLPRIHFSCSELNMQMMPGENCVRRMHFNANFVRRKQCRHGPKVFFDV